jgi:hypothetical protein
MPTPIPTFHDSKNAPSIANRGVQLPGYAEAPGLPRAGQGILLVRVARQNLGW